MKQGSTLFKSLSLAASALVFLPTFAAAAADAGQTTKKADGRQTVSRQKPVLRPPLAKDYVLDSLRKRKPTQREIVRLVKSRGVDFELTDADESELREAGATRALLDALRANYRPAPAAIAADPILIKPDSHDIPYIVPVSPRQESTGPGRGGNNTGGGGMGGGMGTGGGTGVGSGRAPGGAGVGTYPDTYSPAQVTRKAVITSRPAPGYTTEARRNNVSGTVTLRIILAASGEVTNIRVVRGLPDGLTERAINAAKQIKFEPAEKDGRRVSQWAVVEYNFYIY